MTLDVTTMKFAIVDQNRWGDDAAALQCGAEGRVDCGIKRWVVHDTPPCAGKTGGAVANAAHPKLI
jgi:hypothetical protein